MSGSLVWLSGGLKKTMGFRRIRILRRPVTRFRLYVRQRYPPQKPRVSRLHQSTLVYTSPHQSVWPCGCYSGLFLGHTSGIDPSRAPEAYQRPGTMNYPLCKSTRDIRAWWLTCSSLACNLVCNSSDVASPGDPFYPFEAHVLSH